MTKALSVSRASSYFQYIARRRESNQQLLKAPSTLAQRWEMALPHERAVEIALSAPRPAADLDTLPITQSPASIYMQDKRKLSTNTSAANVVQEETSPSPARSSRLDAPVASLGGPVALREQPREEMQLAQAISQHTSRTPTTPEPVSMHRKQLPQVKIPLTPSLAARTNKSAPGMQFVPERPTRDVEEEKLTRVTLRPLTSRKQTVTITPISSGRSVDFAGRQGDESSEQARRPVALPHKQETQRPAAIHIGTIDVHIVPLPPAVPLAPARSAPANPRSASALSREMTSFIGLRQG